jgi:hypothetical protein
MSASLRPPDIEEIKRVVASIPKIDHRILQIANAGRGKVKVTTGYVSGPEEGAGNIVYLEKKGGRWVADIEDYVCWIA